MSAWLTPPFLLAAGLLMLAGLAKLHRPATAGAALIALGLPPGHRRLRELAVRAFATAELILGGICLFAPRPIAAAVLAAIYAGFAVLSYALARRRASCGCFGESDVPASPLQSLLSAALAAVGCAAALGGVDGLSGLTDRAPVSAAVALLGLAGALYAATVAYREGPRAWTAWSPR